MNFFKQKNSSFDFTPSKWVHQYLYSTPEELSSLFTEGLEGGLYCVKNPQKIEEVKISCSAFLAAYLEEFEGKAKDERSALLKLLPLALSKNEEAFSAKEISDRRVNIYVRKPVVLIKPLFLTVSSEAKKVYEGKNLFWGIKFSYPLVYIDPTTMQIASGNTHENASLFSYIRNWGRVRTKNTTFIVKGEKLVTPYRVSMQAFSFAQKKLAHFQYVCEVR